MFALALSQVRDHTWAAAGQRRRSERDPDPGVRVGDEGERGIEPGEHRGLQAGGGLARVLRAPHHPAPRRHQSSLPPPLLIFSAFTLPPFLTESCERSFEDDPNGAVVYSSEGELQIGDFVQVSCTEKQYKLRSGPTFAYCGYQGTWTQPSLPTCQCKEPSLPLRLLSEPRMDWNGLPAFCSKTFKPDPHGIVSYSTLEKDIPVCHQVSPTLTLLADEAHC